MFKLKPLEGGKFKLERERGSSLYRDEKTSRKECADKLSFKNILDKFENNLGNYTFVKSKSADLLSTPTKMGQGTKMGGGRKPGQAEEIQQYWRRLANHLLRVIVVGE